MFSRPLSKISRRLMLMQLGGLLTACVFPKSAPPERLNQLTIGTVTYGEGVRSVKAYERFIQYLESQTRALIQLEPAYNEVKAVEQIQRQIWSLVFAPPGLAALAISKARYLPIFPLQGLDNLSSVLIVLDQSPLQQLADVNGQILALGQPGSATGYYVPLYELYGTTPAEVRIAPTPKTILEWLASSQVGVGAMAKAEFERYSPEFDAPFRILHSSRRIPSGAVLISPQVDRNQQELLVKVMNEALPAIAQEAGYIPNTSPPNYDSLIAFIEKVKPIETRIHEKPAPLYLEK